MGPIHPLDLLCGAPLLDLARGLLSPRWGTTVPDPLQFAVPLSKLCCHLRQYANVTYFTVHICSAKHCQRTSRYRTHLSTRWTVQNGQTRATFIRYVPCEICYTGPASRPCWCHLGWQWPGLNLPRLRTLTLPSTVLLLCTGVYDIIS